MAGYRLGKSLLGKPIVTYPCPHCGAELESPLTDAGRTYPCPTCQRELAVPGEEELEKVRRIEKQKAEFEARHRKQQEAQRKQEELARAAAARQQEQEARLNEALRREAEARGIHNQSVADRFLQFVFRIAKGVSVAIVTVCLIAALLFAVAWAAVRTPPPVQRQQISIPTLAEYRAAISPNRTPGRSGTTPPRSSDEAAPVSPRVAEFRSLLESYDVPASAVSALVGHFETNWSLRADSEFLKALRQFLGEMKSANIPRELRAVAWFIDQYSDAREAAEAAEMQAERKRAHEAAEAMARRALYMTCFAGAVAALLAFLFLPLLIAVEQNTRWMYQRLVAMEVANARRQMARAMG